MQMSLLAAPWRANIEKSLVRNKSLANSRYVQLATVRPDGLPACRTVVYRGFLERTNDLLFITNIHSQKIEDLAQNPMGEVCWYFPKSREQYRLLGSVKVIKQDAADAEMLKARLNVWKRLSDSARAQFAWPVPGVPREAPAEAFDPPPPDKDVVLSTFCLLVMSVHKVDLLDLAKNKRTLFNIIQDSNGASVWSEEDVNP